jgi:hypothetical protein
MTILYETSSEFSLHIEQVALEKNITQLDAIIEYCEENYIDPTDITPLINSTLKSKLERIYQENGMLPKINSLEEFYV